MFLGFPSGPAIKNLCVTQKSKEMWVRFLGGENPLEEGMTTHSCILAWRIPWTGAWRATVHRVAKSWTASSD